jgi:hypothetical protein
MKNKKKRMEKEVKVKEKVKKKKKENLKVKLKSKVKKRLKDREKKVTLPKAKCIITNTNKRTTSISRTTSNKTISNYKRTNRSMRTPSNKRKRKSIIIRLKRMYNLSSKSMIEQRKLIQVEAMKLLRVK